SPALQPNVTLRDPSSAVIGSATASAAGQKALLQATTVTAGGTYTITVGSAASTTGTYTVQVILNAAEEEEGTLAAAAKDRRATAQNIDGSFVPLQTAQGTAQRGALLGGNVQGTLVPVTTFDFESGASGFVINNTPPSGAATGLWHLSTGRGSQ